VGHLAAVADRLKQLAAGNYIRLSVLAEVVAWVHQTVEVVDRRMQEMQGSEDAGGGE
jgi:hypothetical protein